MQIVRFKEGANLQVNMDLTLTKNNMFKLLKIIYSSCAKCWKMEFQKHTKIYKNFLPRQHYLERH